MNDGGRDISEKETVSPPALVLASASPRRRELLEQAGFLLEVVAPDIDETPHPGEDPEAHALRLAGAKAEQVARGRGDRTVLAADTIVVLDRRILGKPADTKDARRMLQLLSGRDHEVITAVALRGTWHGRALDRCWAVRTLVSFRALTGVEIEAYLSGGEPMDKAGAYAIQGGAAHMVRSIRGSYTNVVGLPLAEVVDALGP